MTRERSVPIPTAAGIDGTRRTIVRTIGALALLPTTGVASASSAPSRDGIGAPRTVVELDPTAGELPESIAFDAAGTAYVTLGTGEIRTWSPSALEDGSAGEPFATVSPFGPEDLFAGITATAGGTFYAVQISPTTDLETLEIPASSGTVWRVAADGTTERLAELPADSSADAFPNDVVRRERHGDLLVTDSLRGAVWRVTDDGDATVWLEHPVFEANRDAPFLPIGANGIVRVGDCLYVANTTDASIVRVPIAEDGTAGDPVTVVQDERLFGADGLAADAHGNVYVAVAASEAIARVAPGGRVTILAEGEGLAFPSAVAFGTAPGRERTVYVTNYDAVEALTGGEPEPGLAALEVGVPGRSV